MKKHTNIELGSPIFRGMTQSRLEQYFSILGRNEFSSKYNEGYGDEYDISVKSHPYAKNIGIGEIISIGENYLNTKNMLLDVFGGSGQLRFAMSEYFHMDFEIITADIEVDQIQKAIQLEYPSLCLDATNMEILANNIFNVVLFAYGFHHVSQNKRREAVKEASRIIKKDGCILIHEGMLGGITQKLSYDIVDCHGSSPHLYQHPSSKDMINLASELNLTITNEHNIYDPHVIMADSKEEAELQFLHYYKKHYSLPFAMSFLELTDIIAKIYHEHNFEAWEISDLSERQSWIIGKPYEFNFFSDFADQALQDNIFRMCPRSNNKRWAVVIPRYAKVFEIRKI